MLPFSLITHDRTCVLVSGRAETRLDLTEGIMGEGPPVWVRDSRKLLLLFFLLSQSLTFWQLPETLSMELQTFYLLLVHDQGLTVIHNHA